MLYYRYSNFNSHAHVERDINLFSWSSSTRISTHTLTWSVTLLIIIDLLKVLISTHTLTWSVTSIYYLLYTIYSISTHTLTWSVTLILRVTRTEKSISTHTLTWSVTYYVDDYNVDFLFQLTRSRGA